MTATVPTVADKIRARDLKQALYDRDPSLCRQPFDDWLNTVLQRAAAEWGEDDCAILLRAVVDLEANLADAEARGEPQRADLLRTLRDAVAAMRADLRS